MSKLTKTEPNKIAKFQPTPKMEEWLDMSIELLSTSPTRVSEHLNMNRTRWYSWMKIEGFEDWFFEEYKKRRKRIIAKLDEIAMRNAAKDYRYWEAMNKKVRDLPDSGGTNVNIVGKEMKVDFISYDDES